MAAVAGAAERESAGWPEMGHVTIEAGLVESIACAPTRPDCLRTSQQYCGRVGCSLVAPAICLVGLLRLLLVEVAAAVSSQERAIESVHQRSTRRSVTELSCGIQDYKICTHRVEGTGR